MAVVLITGCSSGFGLLSAVAFAKRGDRVFATMRNLDKARPLKQAAADAGVEIDLLALDVTDRASVDAAVESVIKKAGRIDIVVNNAGIGAVAAVEDFDDDEYQRVFDTNVFGVIRVTRAVLPHMRAQRSGRLIHIGSLSAVVPSQFRSIYSATKAAVAAMSDALFVELSPWGIYSSVIEPGFFATAIGDNRMATRRQGSSDYASLLEQYETGSSPKGSERVAPDPVIDVILQAATDIPPRRHYPVGKDADALTALKAKLPDEEFVRLMMRSMPQLDDA